MLLIQNVDHVLCQIFQLWRFRLVCLWQLIIPFPPAKYNFNNSVSLNAFASKAATNAVSVGTSVMIENFLMTVLSERHFRSFANWLPLSIFPRNSVWGVLTSGLAKGLASVKSGPTCSTNLYDINRKPFTKAPFKTAWGPANDVKYLYQVCYFSVCRLQRQY